MSVDVLISQDENGACCDMVAGFAGGEGHGGHGGFKTDDPSMVKDWLDVYFEAKIIPVANEHTQQVRTGKRECQCLEFLRMLENARPDPDKPPDRAQGNDDANSP